MREGDSITGRRSGRWVRWVGVTVAALVAGAGIGWAGATVLTPAKDVLESTSFTHVEVVPGEVGSSINLNTVAEWTPVPIGTNQASGTVTTVEVTAGDEVTHGSVLYTVNLRPVVIGQGAVPGFRPLARGTDGADTQQMQGLLAALGFFKGTPDGKFGAATDAAVRAWQKSLGIPRDGVVQPGDIVFVPSLPTRVALDTEVIHRGASLAGGEAVVRGLSVEPAFTVPVSDNQSAMMPNGTRVEIVTDAGTWEAFVVDRVTDPASGTVVKLADVDGASICGDDCASLPVTGQTLLRSRIVTVETVQGLVVPSAALLSSAGGAVSVVDEAGQSHPVTVVTSARGMSVIEGVAAGVRVRVPASEG